MLPATVSEIPPDPPAQAPDPAATDSTVAPPVIPDHLKRLWLPALVRVGGRVVDQDQRAAIESLRAFVAAAMQEALGRDVSLELLDEDPLGASTDPVSGVRLLDGDEPLWVSFDEPAARAVVDAVLALAGGTLRGDGPLGEIERGLVEFGCLAMLDALDEACDEADIEGLPGIERFVHGSRLQGALEDDLDEDGALAFRATIGHRQGIVRVHVADLGRELPIPPRASTEQQAAGRLDVSVALPLLPMRTEEFEELVVGDLLMLGVSDLGELTAGAKLITATGWSLGEVRIQNWKSPTRVPFLLGAFDPQVRLPEGDDPTCEYLSLTIGSGVLDARDLIGWKPNEPFGLPVDPGHPVRLAHDGRILGSAELGQHEGELALRITEWERSK